MILKRRVALNGLWLDEIDERIVVTGIKPSDANENITTTEAAGGYGSRITGRGRTMLDVIVSFQLMINGRYGDGMQQAAELLEKVNAWARNGGWLTAAHKPDRRISVMLAQAPGEDDVFGFGKKEYQLTFRAYGVPYWEQEQERSVTFGGGNSSGSNGISVDGSAQTQADVVLTNTSGMTINNATIHVGGKSMSFENLGLGGGESLTVDHSDGLVRIRIGGRSAMQMRTSSSADDFMINPGGNAVWFSAQRACRMTVSWRGRYL